MNNLTRIETCGPLELMGVALYGNPAVTQFHDAWQHFGKVADELSLTRIGKNLYGLQIYPPWFPQRFEITYIASIERERGMKVPIWMVTKTLPQCTYVVQNVVGGVDGIDRALEYLYKEYIPKNGLKPAMPFDFEKYCNLKSHDSTTDEIEVWVPIKEGTQCQIQST
jgi:predicted transcriptional regulator YdeE